MALVDAHDRLGALLGPINALALLALLVAAGAELSDGAVRVLTGPTHGVLDPGEELGARRQPDGRERAQPRPEPAPTPLAPTPPRPSTTERVDGPLGPSTRLGYGL